MSVRCELDVGAVDHHRSTHRIADRRDGQRLTVLVGRSLGIVRQQRGERNRPHAAVFRNARQ